MSEATEQLYAERLRRYTTALRNEKPDKIPIRPFVAEFTAKYAGYTHVALGTDSIAPNGAGDIDDTAATAAR